LEVADLGLWAAGRGWSREADTGGGDALAAEIGGSRAAALKEVAREFRAPADDCCEGLLLPCDIIDRC